MNDWRTWLKSLVAAGIVGGSSALSTSGLLSVLGKPLDLHQVAAIFGVAAIHGAAAYLTRSPLPGVTVPAEPPQP